MWKKDKTVRLEKKTSIKDKSQEWKKNNQHYLNVILGIFTILGIIFVLIIFVLLIVKFAPGTESGSWYNGLKGVI